MTKVGQNLSQTKVWVYTYMKFLATLMTDINRCLMLFRGITADYCENGMRQRVTLWGQNPVFFFVENTVVFV